MSKREDEFLIEDMLISISRILEYTENIDFQDFLDDYKTVDAVIRNLEIIGEASNRLSKQIRILNPKVDWINVTGLRNRLIHEYFGVNLEVIWDVIQLDIPNLKKELTIIKYPPQDNTF